MTAPPSRDAEPDMSPDTPPVMAAPDASPDSPAMSWQGWVWCRDGVGQVWGCNGQECLYENLQGQPPALTRVTDSTLAVSFEFAMSGGTTSYADCTAQQCGLACLPGGSCGVSYQGGLATGTCVAGP